MKTIYFSVGICAFNEAKNIKKLLKSIIKQKLPLNFKLKEIIVVASGCSDNTGDIVKKMQKKFKFIYLYEQEKREGKAVAVNIFLKNTKTNLLFLQSADTIPNNNCYRFMLEALNEKNVGMVGCKVMPLDNPNTFCGFANRLKWSLHHEINIKYPERPKLGELIAFKKIFSRIPPKTVVDEASIEPLIKLQDFKAVYEPNAIVYNLGPQNIREYLSQRRRIYAGHYETKIKYGYEVITFSNFSVIPVFLSKLKYNPKFITYAFLTAYLEVIARGIGFIDIKFKLRDHHVWKVSPSSKKLLM